MEFKIDLLNNYYHTSIEITNSNNSNCLFNIEINKNDSDGKYSVRADLSVGEFMELKKVFDYIELGLKLQNRVKIE